MAKQLTMRDIVKSMLDLGYEVTYRERSDGGIRITSIGGVKFKDSKGNITARSIVGATLSEARAKQLGKISIKKGSKRSPVSDATREKIKKINENLKAREKELKKKGAKRVELGRVRIKQYRENREAFGEEEADALLDRTMRYSEGLVQISDLKAIVERLRNDAISLKGEEADTFLEIANELERLADAGAPNFKHEYFQEIINYIYDREKGAITTKEMRRRVMPWINAGR